MPDIATTVSVSLESLLGEFDTITHNIANANTTGYKRRCAGFAEALRSNLGTVIEPDDISALTEPVFDFSQGALMQTGRSLDLALSGQGFFVLETPDGPLYTRNGVFQVNQNGQVVDSEGRLVAGEAGPLVIPATLGSSQVAVSNDGAVYAEDVEIGRLRVVVFPDTQDRLLPAGRSCWYAPPDMLPVNAEEVIVKQGYREESNVKVIDELVDMITVTRTYEANVKLVNVSSDTTNSLLSVAMG